MTTIKTPSEFESSIRPIAEGMMENIIYFLRDHPQADLDELREELSSLPIDSTNAVDLSLSERFSVVDEYADKLELALVDATIDNVRLQIETLAGRALHFAAQEQVSEVLNDMNAFLEDRDLEFGKISETNPFGWAAHQSERDEDDFTVYEYRGLEAGEIDVDVWHYQKNRWSLYVSEYLKS